MIITYETNILKKIVNVKSVCYCLALKVFIKEDDTYTVFHIYIHSYLLYLKLTPLYFNLSAVLKS